MAKRDVAGEADAVGVAERPTPWEIRTLIVRALVENPQGLTVPEIIRYVAEKLGHPLRDSLDPDLESLMSLGVIEHTKTDSRRLAATSLADRYLVGAEVLFGNSADAASAK